MMNEETVSLNKAIKSTRFTVIPVKENFEYSSKSLNVDGECRKNLLYDCYYNNDLSSEEAFDPYSIFMSMYYPLDNGTKQTKLEKFKAYWENDSFYAIWRRKFIKEHSCDEHDMWKEVHFSYISIYFLNLLSKGTFFPVFFVFVFFDTMMLNSVRQN